MGILCFGPHMVPVPAIVPHFWFLMYPISQFLRVKFLLLRGSLLLNLPPTKDDGKEVKKKIDA